MLKKHLQDWNKKTYVKYGELVFDILTVPPDIYKNTPEQVKLIFVILRDYLPRAKKILDIPCGDGRISLGLLAKGYEIRGMDISPSYIKKARLKSKSNKKTEFSVKDMRQIDFKEEFDALVNWFGSFGYFDDEANEKVLERFINSLKNNGLLIMDLTNRDHTIQKMGNFYEWQPEIVFRKGKKKLYCKYEFDLLTNRIQVTIQIEDTKKKIYYQMRYYSVNELVSMLEKKGMKVIQMYGDYQGNKFSLFSPRLVIVARK